MRTFLTALLLLAMAGAAYTQDDGQQGEGKAGRGHGRKHGQMAGVFEVFKTFKGLRTVSQELDAEQKTKFDEAVAKLADKIKAAQADFEADLSGILTAEQMQKYADAKAAPSRRGGREGRKEKGRRGQPEEGGRKKRSIADRLKAMDADGDGNVSKEEFKGREELFERFDADKDGVISCTEVEAIGNRKSRRKPEAQE